MKLKNFTEKISNFCQNNEPYLLGALLTILISLALATNLLTPTENDLSKLGWSFMHGQTYFINDVSNADIIIKNNHIYLAFPPLPAALFIPFNLLWQQPVSQNIIGSLLLIPTFLLIYYLLRKRFQFSVLNSLWLATCYFFSSVFIIAVFFPGNTNFFCHVLTTLLLTWALIEFFGKKRYWLIGILAGLLFLTRLTAGIAGLFFLFYLLFDHNLAIKNKIKQLILLSLPVIICGFLLLGYNFIRFGNHLETGYTQTASYQNFPELRTHGLFSYKYIPDNFYHYFLELLGPNYVTDANNQARNILKAPYVKKHDFGSLSFFLVAPLFLLLFKADKKNKINQYLFISAGIVLLVLLNYYYNGYPQIGPRYANDFLPLFFIALLLVLKQKGLNYKHKLLITFSAIFNTLVLLFL